MKGFSSKLPFQILPVFLMSLLIVSCSNPSPREKLEGDIARVLNRVQGTCAVAWHDLDTGEKLLINQDSVFHAASTMKTPVMIEVFKQASQGDFAITDSILVKNEFFSIMDSSLYSLSPDDDSETELYSVVGQKLPIYDLVYRMIIRSSNLATNLIIDLVDARKVTQSMRGLGAARIEILRGVEDTKAYEAGRSNTTTALDLMRIYEALASGTLLSEDANAQMLEILFNQQFDDIIPAQLPSEVKVAHKTGSITGVHHDSGIIFMPDGRKYVLVLLSKELEDFDAGTNALAEISGLIYQYVIH